METSGAMPSKAGDLLRDASPLHRLPARDVAVHKPSHQDTDRAAQASSMSVAPCERPVYVDSFLLGGGEWTVEVLDEPMRGRRAPVNLARFSAQRHSVQDPEDIDTEYQDLWFSPAPASQNNSPPFIVCLAVTFLDVIAHWLMALCNGLEAWVTRNYPPVVDPRARVRSYSEPPMHLGRMHDSEDQESDHDVAMAGEHTRPAASDTRQTWEDRNKATEGPVEDSALETHGFEIQHGTGNVDEVIQSVGNSSGSSMHMATSSSFLRPRQTALPSPHLLYRSQSVPEGPSSDGRDEIQCPVNAGEGSEGCASAGSRIKRTEVAIKHSGHHMNAQEAFDGEGGDEVGTVPGLENRDFDDKEPAHLHNRSAPTPATDMLGGNEPRTSTIERRQGMKGGRGMKSRQVSGVATRPANNPDNVTSTPAEGSQQGKSGDTEQSYKGKASAAAKSPPTSWVAGPGTRRSGRYAAAASPASSQTPELTASSRRTRRMAKKDKGNEAGQPSVCPDA